VWVPLAVLVLVAGLSWMVSRGLESVWVAQGFRGRLLWTASRVLGWPLEPVVLQGLPVLLPVSLELLVRVVLPGPVHLPAFWVALRVLLTLPSYLERWAVSGLV